MKIRFASNDLISVIEQIKGYIPEDLLKSMEITHDDQFVYITIKKLGTSTFRYKWELAKDGQLIWKLEDEKIAFAHKQFYEQINAKIASIVRKVNGVIET